MNSAEEVLAAIVANVRPPKGCAIVLTEAQSNGPNDPNWVTATGTMSADCIQRYVATVSELRRTHRIVDWSGVKVRVGDNRRVALYLSEIEE